MPQLGATMTEGKLVEWLVQEGGTISRGQPIARIETDKIVAEVEAPVDGVLAGIAAWPEDTVEVTGLLAWVVSPGELPPMLGSKPVPAPQQAIANVLASVPQRPSPTSEAALSLDVTRHRLDSTGVAATVTLFSEADASELCRLRAEFADELQSLVGYLALFAEIAAQALREFPCANVRLTDEGVEQISGINLGVVLDTGQGPREFVILSADRRGLAEIHREIQGATEPSHRIAPDSTIQVGFQVSCLGTYGVGRYTPLVASPQGATLGIGEISAQPTAVAGTLMVREIVSLSLSFDHRLMDGGMAARFLQRVVQLVEEPYGLWT